MMTERQDHLTYMQFYVVYTKKLKNTHQILPIPTLDI